MYSCGITPYDVAHLGHADRAGEPYDRFAAIQESYFWQDMTSLRIAEPST